VILGTVPVLELSDTLGKLGETLGTVLELSDTLGKLGAALRAQYSSLVQRLGHSTRAWCSAWHGTRAW
jgi:hypothetical protein